MTFDLDSAALAWRDRARTTARAVGPAAADRLDSGEALDAGVRTALRSVLPTAADHAPLDWVVGVEELAVVSPALALAAAADTLGVAAVGAGPAWPGCRGLDLDALAATNGAAWQAAVTAVLNGGARAAVEAAVDALRAARHAGRSVDAAQPAVADAATAVDASRLLLWDAMSRPADAATAALARLHALASVATAVKALEGAVGPEGLRPGTALERVRRDLDAVVLVLGGERAARDAAASALSER